MIDDSIIIQVDATVIAGLLVLLSISMIWRSKTEKIRPITTIIKSKGLYLTPNQVFAGVIPFSASAMCIIVSSSQNDIFHFLSVYSIMFGFFLMSLFAAIIVFSEKKENLDLS